MGPGFANLDAVYLGWHHRGDISIDAFQLGVDYSILSCGSIFNNGGDKSGWDVYNIYLYRFVISGRYDSNQIQVRQIDLIREESLPEDLPGSDLLNEMQSVSQLSSITLYWRHNVSF